jgi:SAM-dependent methyltransferase
MEHKNWNEYFYSHYRPEEGEWGIKDLEKYKRWYYPWMQFLKKKFNFKDKTALELGCGIGAFTALLNNEGCKATGTDIADKMIAHAKKTSSGVEFLVYDVMEPFPVKKTFDYVFAFEVLEHIPQLDRAVSSIYTLVKQGGYFIGSTPYPYKKNMIDLTHINVHLPFFWKTCFESNGFSRVDIVPLSVPPLLWSMLIHCYISFPGFVSTTLIMAKK